PSERRQHIPSIPYSIVKEQLLISNTPEGPKKLAGPNHQVKNLSPGGEERSTPHPIHRQQRKMRRVVFF
ncbi:hypothetical protein, partial [Gluconacetobacter asukensis]